MPTRERSTGRTHVPSVAEHKTGSDAPPDRHREIQESALELFATIGYRATTMAQIGERVGIRGPSLYNVQMIPVIAEGRLLSDMMAIIGSLDFVMGEVDR